MSAESFLDTNILVYQLERLDTRKADIADALILHRIDSQTACISFQVIQECLNTAIRKAEVPLTEDEMRTYSNSEEARGIAAQNLVHRLAGQ